MTVTVGRTFTVLAVSTLLLAASTQANADYWGYQSTHIYGSTSFWSFDSNPLWNSDEASLKFTAGVDASNVRSVRIWSRGGATGTYTMTVTLETAGSTSWPASITPDSTETTTYPGVWNVPSGTLVSGTASTTVAMTNNGAAYDIDLGGGSSDFALTKDTVYHLHIKGTPSASGDRLRLRVLGPKLNDGLNYLGNDNVRPYDGVSQEVSDTKRGDDTWAVIGFSNTAYYGSPVVWTEGEIYNNGVLEYAKYHEPVMEFLDSDGNVIEGLGGGYAGVSSLATGGTGELFNADASLTAVGSLGMFVKALDPNVGGGDALTLSLLDSTGATVASGTATFTAIDGAAGWAEVALGSPVALTDGEAYRLVASSVGEDDYQLYVHTWNDTGVTTAPEKSISFQGAAAGFWDGSALVDTQDALFRLGPIPEPGTLALMGLGTLGLLRRRRRSA